MAIDGGFIPEGAVKPSSLEVDSYEPNISAYKHVEIPSNLQARYIYDANGMLTYAGYAPTGLQEGSLDNLGNPNGWLLQQYTNVNGQCTKRLIAYGNWTSYLSATYQ
jgi:hypothetical protein